MLMPYRAFSEPEAISGNNTVGSQTRSTAAALSPVEGEIIAHEKFSIVETAKFPREISSSQQLDTPAKLNNYIQTVTRNITKDVDASRTAEVSRQAGFIQQAANNLSPRNMEYPVTCKFIVPSLCHSYTEAVRLLQEGARISDSAKMRLGLEKLEQANKSGSWQTIQQAYGKAQTNQSKP